MRRFSILILYVLGIVVLIHVSDAQDGIWTHWTTVNSMSHLVVQDNFIWAGINEGLIRYNTIDGSFERFTIENGLPNNQVKPLILDNNGNLWAGYGKYIGKYDNNKKWSFWDIQEGDRSYKIESFYQDKHGNMWVGFNGGGILRFNRENWRFWGWEELAGDWISVHAFDEDSNGNIWAATDFHGLYKFDGNIWTQFKREDGANDMYSIMVDDRDNIWIGTFQDVARFDGDTWTSWVLFPDVPNRHVWCLLEDSEGILWAGSGGGVSRFDGVKWTHWGTDDGMASWMTLLHEDTQGNIWAVSNRDIAGSYPDNGIFMFDGYNWKNFTVDDGLPGNMVYSLTEDENGTIWAGTDDGLCYFDGYQWNSWEWLPSIHGAEVFDIIEDGNGSVWVSTYAGVSRFDGFGWTKMLDYPGKNFAGPTPDGPFAIDVTGNVWIGLGSYNVGGPSGIGGLSRYDGENWTVWNRKTPGFYFSGFVRELMPDSHGNMWAGTELAGAMKFDGEQWIVWSDNEYPEYDRIYTLVEDNYGNIWAGSDDSIRCFDGNTWTLYTPQDGFYPGPVESLVKDSKGHIWALSHAASGNDYSGGLNVYDGQQWRKIDGLVDMYTTCMTIDTEGSIWIGSLNGVSRFDGVEWKTWENGLDYGVGWATSILSDDYNRIWLGLRPVVDENRVSKGGGVAMFDGNRWETWTTGDGLPSNSVTCLYQDNDGNIWVGMENGVSRLSGYETAVNRDKQQPNNISITGVYPNPFNAQSTISFSLPGEGFTELAIYNLMGQKIKELVAQILPSGNHTIVWDGRNNKGESVSSGIYFTMLKQHSSLRSGKILLLK
ncbi:MAG: T9SS type A sorting domain-containing protein [Candidatus Latescibacteria bacterium]|nr:T9SS type A sorting domain-containing protein [Candidatus Latescibacterota bacterium]